jgi:hypothetical protein
MTILFLILVVEVVLLKISNYFVKNVIVVSPIAALVKYTTK